MQTCFEYLELFFCVKAKVIELELIISPKISTYFLVSTRISSNFLQNPDSAIEKSMFPGPG